MPKKISEQTKEFNRGYICALSCITQSHGITQEVEDGLAANFMTESQMKTQGIDSFDIIVLRPIIKEIVRKNNLLK